MLISWLPIAQTAHNLSKEAGVGGLDGLFPSIEVVAGVLGFTGITKATLEQIKWKEYFKEASLKNLKSSTGRRSSLKPFALHLSRTNFRF